MKIFDVLSSLFMMLHTQLYNAQLVKVTVIEGIHSIVLSAFIIRLPGVLVLHEGMEDLLSSC